MKLRFLSTVASMIVSALSVFVAGCGSKTSAIATTITLSSSIGSTLILGQSTTITAVVTGPTNTDVTWSNPQKNLKTACAYTTTTIASNGTANPPSTAVDCPSDGSLGTVSNEQTTGTATYLAPSVLPDPTKFPGLQIQIWACTVATPIKCNDVALAIDSGVSVAITPVTAAVPTSEKQPFVALLANDLQSKGVTWLLTQQIPQSSTTTTNTNVFASLTTCTVSGNASGCGSIDANGIYTAPAAVPTATVPANTTTAPTDCTTPQNLTIVATSVEDPTRFAIGTITVTQGGPIQFNGITPTIAPQGAFFWDIFLNATNISSSSFVTLTDANNGKTILNSGTGQMKVLFPVTAPTTGTSTGTGSCAFTPTTPAPSTGAKIRLNAAQLASTGPVTISVSDPAQPVTQCTGNPLPAGCSSAGTFTYNIVPVRPTVVSSSPNDVVQNTSGSASTTNPRLTIDGGYFGPGGQLANAFFGNQALSGSTNGQGNPTSYAKQLDVEFPAGQVNTGLPGLYSLSVSLSSTSPPPFVNNPAVGDLAVFPSYLTDPPLVVSSLSTGAGTFPSAADIDPDLGVLVAVETGSTGNANATPPIPPVPGAVQFYSIGNGTLTPLGSPVPVGISPGPSVLPTGLSVNRTNHTVAVVNYGEQSVTVLPIPGAPVQAPGTPFSFTIAGVLQGTVNPAPLPYSIGVDPDTNMGVVAYSSTSTSSASNLGFLVDLNSNGTSACLPFTNGPAKPPCAFAQVTLNTGAYPHVAMAPHGHLAFVSPGGSGALRGVDVTKPSTSIGLKSLTLAAGIVTVTTAAPTNNNILFPGNAGTVLITGVPTQNSAGNTNFNGVYTAAIISDTSFTYISPSQSSGTVTITQNSDGSYPANVFFSSPNLTYGGVSQTTQGIAINPISRTAALADANSTGTAGPQLYVVNSLDQTVSTIGFQLGCTFYYNAGCQGGPELLGTADVAWQPYSNEIVSYNPGTNQVSVSDPVTARRHALACEIKTGSTAAGCIVDPGTESKNGGPHCQAGTLAACTQEYLNQIALQGTGTATISATNGTTGTLTLSGGLAVDAATNQAFVVMSGSNQIDVVNLGPCSQTGNSDQVPVTLPCANPFNYMKPAQITDILVPTPATPPPPPGAIGGIPGATVPEGALTSTTDLAGVQIFGSGFDAQTSVQLDGTAIPANDVTFVSSRQLTVTIPAVPFLSFPHRFALDVTNGGGVKSNATDFLVVQAVDLSKVCPNILDANGNPVATMPSSVAIADQLVNGPFSPIAVVTNFNCNNVVVVDINPTATVNGQTVQNPNFGTILSSIAVGKNPEGVAVSEPFGLAVVANNADGTAAVINLLTNALAVPSVSTGTNPTGVAINDETGAALVANTGSNTVSELNLAPLFGSPPATSVIPVSIGGFQQPTAVAIDPDRGTNNQGIAVVTGLSLQSGSAPTGSLFVVDIGTATPSLSSTAPTGLVTAPATGLVFDPTVVTGANAGVFYASSSGGNVITSFNPDSGTSGSVNVGINPTALALNPQTGAILTTNVAGKTTSIVDTTASPLKTVRTIGLPGSPQFGIAIDQFTNLAVIVDQGNNRLLIMEVPK